MTTADDHEAPPPARRRGRTCSAWSSTSPASRPATSATTSDDRPPERLPWFDDGAARDADMWASADESRASVLALRDRVRVHSEATVAALPLDAPGVVPWWSPEERDVTLHQVLVHLVAQTARHAGHADVVPELLDGAVGRTADDESVRRDEAGWREHRVRLQAVAEAVER